MYRVIIVEDDPMVAELNRKYLEKEQEFIVVGDFRNGTEAMEYLRENQVELAILDYYMPVMNGREMIIACHDERIYLDFIMITAANKAAEISDLVHLGVVDYLVKPFTAARFRTALSRYLELKGRLESKGKLTQEEIDRILSRNTPPLPGDGAPIHELSARKGGDRQLHRLLDRRTPRDPVSDSVKRA